jgi:hypothetical protein
MGYRTIALDTILSLTVALGSVAVVDSLLAVDTKAETNKRCAVPDGTPGGGAVCECGPAQPPASGSAPPRVETNQAQCAGRPAAAEASTNIGPAGGSVFDPATAERKALMFAGVVIAARIAKRRLRLYQAIGTSE